MLIQDEGLLADIACIEPIAVHGLLGVINLGDTFLACYYRWRPIRYDAGGNLMREKSVALTLLLPRNSARPGGKVDRWLNAQPVAKEIAEALAMRH
jgi:hypothetical protein